MRAHLPVLLLVPLTLCALAPAQAELRHNPFARAFETPAKQPGYGAAGSTSTGDMVLRAVLYDEVQPMINVDGTILGLGEEYAGHELREVSRHSAVFHKDGRTILLQLGDSDELLAGSDD